ncbi:MAG: flavin reductase family protein, partial [Pseudomonadota bacterium]|nr:flavin reductase family protein [Pseudomonadota bacterium]
MRLQPESLDNAALYQLVIGTVAPRPIAWVSTRSATGVVNLAPYSYFTVASMQPLSLLFCPQRQPDGSAKDTLRNLDAVPEFVVHIPDQATLDAMNVCSWRFPPDVSELTA